MVHGYLWFMVHDSLFLVHDSWFTVHDYIWLMVHGEWLIEMSMINKEERSCRDCGCALMVQGSWLMVNGYEYRQTEGDA